MNACCPVSLLTKLEPAPTATLQCLLQTYGAVPQQPPLPGPGAAPFLPEPYFRVARNASAWSMLTCSGRRGAAGTPAIAPSPAPAASLLAALSLLLSGCGPAVSARFRACPPPALPLGSAAGGAAAWWGRLPLPAVPRWGSVGRGGCCPGAAEGGAAFQAESLPHAGCPPKDPACVGAAGCCPDVVPFVRRLRAAPGSRSGPAGSQAALVRWQWAWSRRERASGGIHC